MTVKEFIDSKIDWRAYNMLIDSITPMEDRGVSCTIEMTVSFTKHEEDKTYPCESIFYIYSNGELNWQGCVVSDFPNLVYEGVFYDLEIDNNRSKESLNDIKIEFQNIFNKISNKLFVRTHGMTWIALKQIDK